MKKYKVNAWYSEIIEAGSEDDAIEKMWDMIINGMIKRYEWEFDSEEDE